MYVNLSKKFITENLLPFLSQSKLGRKLKVPLWRIVKAIIYRLKTGCQWRELPIRAFCSGILITWNTVYYHFNKWSKDGSWKKLWTRLLNLNKSNLDMSSKELLEIGSGSGELAEYFSLNGAIVTTIDSCIESYNGIQIKHYQEFFDSNFLNKNNKLYDIIINIDFNLYSRY